MKSVFVLVSVLTSVYGHAVITLVTGDNGVTTSGFGVTTDGSIPRNGTTEQPFQLDTPVLKNLVDFPCGATLLNGAIDMPSSLATAITQGGGDLPSLASDDQMLTGEVRFEAVVNTDGTGQTWTPALITQQPPGANGLLSGGPVESQVTAAVPSGTTCTGTSGSVSGICLIRISNGGNADTTQSASFANGAGPFGGCFALPRPPPDLSVSVASASATSVATTAAAAASTTTTAATNKTSKKKNARSIELIGRLVPSLFRRQSEMDALVAKHRALDDELHEKVVTPRLQADAVNLKAALRTQVEGVLAAFAANQNASLLTGSNFNFSGNLSSETVAQANSDADAAQAAGTTSINAGDAGVGEVQTAVKNSLLGGVSDVQTITNNVDLLGASSTAALAAAAATTTSAAATAATTAAAAKNKATTKHAKSGRALDKRSFLSRLMAFDFE
ncbi:hypothetical protein BT96DRAFT_939353 [Gymnopus androsaceus JB14]|uniref:Uncharacterized protein n=1 Tax=Gymnopus androsaceus JB14 TaxID=1447944 RepID=A0A6A4HS44_9AGAR|nr:hypothetical protein BT96DRAFT_939353 [Gymnopus androsaceus JB14]